MSERPKWAQGAEWDGWEISAWPVLSVAKRSVVTSDAAQLYFRLYFTIYNDGQLLLDSPAQEGFSISFPSPEAARVAAMAIIEGMK